MTVPDPDAWWSPVPQGPALEPPTVPAAHVAPARPPRRRWPWVVGASALVLVLCLALVVVLVVTGTQTLTDRARTVSVAVPRSWYDNTGDPGSDPGSPPVLAASNLWQSRWVEVDRYDVDATDSLQSFHADGVDRECAGWPCTTRSGPKTLTVAGHEALEQVVTHPGDADGGATSALTLTVWLDGRAVELYTGATGSGDRAPDAAPLEKVAASLRLL